MLPEQCILFGILMFLCGLFYGMAIEEESLRKKFKANKCKDCPNNPFPMAKPKMPDRIDDFSN